MSCTMTLPWAWYLPFGSSICRNLKHWMLLTPLLAGILLETLLKVSQRLVTVERKRMQGKLYLRAIQRLPCRLGPLQIRPSTNPNKLLCGSLKGKLNIHLCPAVTLLVAPLLDFSPERKFTYFDRWKAGFSQPDSQVWSAQIFILNLNSSSTV